MEGMIPIMLYLVSEDIVRNGQTEQSLYRSRAILNGIMGDSREVDKLDMDKEYGPDSSGMASNDGYHTNYIEPTEEGYPGLGAPL